MANDYHSALATCGGTNTCGDLNLFNGDGAIIDLVNLSAAVPLLMGLFWGVTAIGRELDTGTHQLVWMQSVRQKDWLRGKIALLLVAAAIWGAAVSAIVTWWSGTLNSLNGNRFDPGKFDVQGLMPVAYAIFGVAWGLRPVRLLRRVLPALAVTVAVFVAVRLIVEHLRPAVLRGGDKPLCSRFPSTRRCPAAPGCSRATSCRTASRSPASCASPPSASRPTTRQASDACLAQHGFASLVKFQPASRYWTFQWIESGIFVALAAILVAAAVIAVRRRDA